MYLCVCIVVSEVEGRITQCVQWAYVYVCKCIDHWKICLYVRMHIHITCRCTYTHICVYMMYVQLVMCIYIYACVRTNVYVYFLQGFTSTSTWEYQLSATCWHGLHRARLCDHSVRLGPCLSGRPSPLQHQRHPKDRKYLKLDEYFKFLKVG